MKILMYSHHIYIYTFTSYIDIIDVCCITTPNFNFYTLLHMNENKNIDIYTRSIITSTITLTQRCKMDKKRKNYKFSFPQQ